MGSAAYPQQRAVLACGSRTLVYGILKTPVTGQKLCPLRGCSQDSLKASDASVSFRQEFGLHAPPTFLISLIIQSRRNCSQLQKAQKLGADTAAVRILKTSTLWTGLKESESESLRTAGRPTGAFGSSRATARASSRFKTRAPKS